MVGMCAALMGGAFGCELISTVDRSLIDGSGGSTSSSVSSSSSGGTGGSAPECKDPVDCPAAPSECVTPICDSGKCGTSPVAAGTLVGTPTVGDCKAKQCDGAGAMVDVNLDTDVPDDKKACTNDVCTAGVPSNPNSAAGTACGGALKCDGKGACVGCVTATDCPGANDECQTQTCSPTGVCGTAFTAAGTVTTAQTAGDCKQNQCDGTGAVMAAVLATDLPVDANPCTDNICTGNVPSNPNTTAGGVCAAGGTVCNGAGTCVTCLTAATCPAAANECQVAVCSAAGTCGFTSVAAGTATTAQTAGDCKKSTCSGTGTIVIGNDDTDLPNDSNPCTNDVCTAGVVSHTPAAAGTACGTAQVCNATGSCGCTAPSDCPGTNNECQTKTCVANACGFNFTAAGTMTTAQTVGDCKKNQCNGSGTIVPATDNTDLPVDANECTSNICTAGVPSNPPTALGTTCTVGGTVCNGNSACVACNTAANCAGTDTDCHARTCMLNICGVANTAPGTATTAQSAGDCQEVQCNGAGATMSVAKNLDVPVDANQCTDNVCMAGVPSNPNSAAGATCTTGGTVCSGAGTCVACVVGSDCTSGVCGAGNVCAAPSCTDGVKNGIETDLDCGGGTCPTCALTKGCTVANDCSSGTCTTNVCSLINGCDFSTATDLTGSAGTMVTFANGNFTYAPKCIKVSAGTVVTFNGSFSGHPLQGGVATGGVGTPASSGPFMTLTNSGTTVPFTMAAAGTFPYYCTFHVGSGMTGTVFVVP